MTTEPPRQPGPFSSLLHRARQVIPALRDFPFVTGDLVSQGRLGDPRIRPVLKVRRSSWQDLLSPRGAFSAGGSRHCGSVREVRQGLELIYCDASRFA